MISYVVQFRRDETDTWRDDEDYRPFSDFYEAAKAAVESASWTMSASEYPVHTRVVKRIFEKEVFVFKGESE